MYGATQTQLRGELAAIRSAGLYKDERSIHGAQRTHVVARGDEVLNFCSNNYLGLAADPAVIGAAHRALDTYGFGMASVRFICGTQDQHTVLENDLARFHGADAAILYSSCFDANGGIFETLLGPEDAVISDALNHASIIDGIRLSRAQRHRYANRDLADLEQKLAATHAARRRLIVTDGVFSMDGYLAPLDAICDLADRYDALVMVDDSHAVGVLGATGAGTAEHFGVRDRIDIIAGTLGKALGGASGGYIAAHQEIVDLLRQRSRPYLFSNSVAPAVVAGSATALEIARTRRDLRTRLHTNAALFRSLMTEAGFTLLPGDHPIVPVMFGDAAVASAVADEMLSLGVYVVAFSYPVVPANQARIRVQMTASHSEEDVRAAVDAFVRARQRVSGRASDGQR